MERSWRNNAPTAPYPQAKSSTRKAPPAPRAAHTGRWMAFSARASVAGMR